MFIRRVRFYFNKYDQEKMLPSNYAVAAFEISFGDLAGKGLQKEFNKKLKRF